MGAFLQRQPSFSLSGGNALHPPPSSTITLINISNQPFKKHVSVKFGVEEIVLSKYVTGTLNLDLILRLKLNSPGRSLRHNLNPNSEMCPSWAPTQFTGQTQHFSARPAHGKNMTVKKIFFRTLIPFSFLCPSPPVLTTSLDLGLERTSEVKVPILLLQGCHLHLLSGCLANPVTVRTNVHGQFTTVPSIREGLPNVPLVCQGQFFLRALHWLFPLPRTPFPGQVGGCLLHIETSSAPVFLRCHFPTTKG